MAKVYDYKGNRSSFPALLEDPRVTRDEIYIFGFTHDKTSLSPVFNSELGTSAAGQIAAAGITNLNSLIDTTDNVTTQRTDQLFLTKPTVHVSGRQAAVNTQAIANNAIPDDVMWWTMDRAYEYGGNLHLITDGASKTLFLTAGPQGAVVSSTRNRSMYGPISDTTKLSESSVASTVNAVYTTLNDTLANIRLIGVNSTSKLVFGVAAYAAATNGFFSPSYAWRAIGPEWPTSVGTGYSSITNLPNGSQPQFLGMSLIDNQPLFFVTNRLTLTASATVQKVIYQAQTPTITQLYTVTAAVSAGGTNAGGNRMAGSYYPASCSSIFTDPRVEAGTRKCWYYPYFDSSRNFHPVVFTWDQTTDTFNRETDITVTGDLSSVHADMTGLFAWASTTNAHVCGNMACHTFVNNGVRYVMFINIDSRNQYSTNTGPRTSVVYTVDATDPKNLTYHSKITWPDTLKNFVFLNDDQTLMGMFFQTVFKVYAWNNTSGWVETASIDKLVTSCGMDAAGRIWYVQVSDSQSIATPELHILTPSLPITINIQPELSSYNYAGTPINSYIDINALNVSGNRFAANVKLVIQGDSMTFSDNTTIKTVTTLTDQDFRSNIIIKGSGFSNITASVEL